MRVLLLLIFSFSVQSFAAVVPCELLLARGPRGAYHDRRASVRMLPASARNLELEHMGAPTPEERDDIYRKATPVEGKPPATAFVRVALEYLVTRNDWSPFQKAVFWEQVAIDIDQLPGIGFGNVSPYDRWFVYVQWNRRRSHRLSTRWQNHARLTHIFKS